MNSKEIERLEELIDEMEREQSRQYGSGPEDTHRMRNEYQSRIDALMWRLNSLINKYA